MNLSLHCLFYVIMKQKYMFIVYVETEIDVHSVLCITYSNGILSCVLKFVTSLLVLRHCNYENLFLFLL